MPRLLRPLALGLCVVVAQVAFAPPAAARQYTLTPIPIGDYDILTVQDVNNAGQVVGDLRRTGEPLSSLHGFVWSAAGGLTDLGAGLLPSAIGNQGSVVGTVIGSDPFIWTPAQGVRRLSSLPGGDAFRRAEAHDINGAGQVLGFSSDAQYGAFIYNPNGTVRVLPLPAEADGLPLDTSLLLADRLTEAGDAVGRTHFYRDGSRAIHGTVWPAGGGVRLLDDLPGGPIWSEAYQMNSRGQIAGSAMNEAALQRPVMWAPDGRVIDLGLLPGKTVGGTSGINEAGEVIGWSGGNDAEIQRAFVWTESQGLLDLNNLLDGTGAGWTLRSAQAINDSGQILVQGTFDGHFTGALLTPLVPDPGALGMLAAVAVMTLHRRSSVERAR